MAPCRPKSLTARTDSDPRILPPMPMLTQTLTRQGMGRSMISYGHQMAQPHPANLVEACASSRLAMALVQHKWRDTLAQNPTGDTMALLLKLESKIINLDNVFEIED